MDDIEKQADNKNNVVIKIEKPQIQLQSMSIKEEKNNVIEFSNSPKAQEQDNKIDIVDVVEDV